MTGSTNCSLPRALLPMLLWGLATGCGDDDIRSLDASMGGHVGIDGSTSGTNGGTGSPDVGLADICGTDGETGDDSGDRAGCPAEIPVDADITSDTTWSCPSYLLTTRIYVHNGARLTIDPGTVIKSAHPFSPGAAPGLVVARGSRLVARGTASQPIVFTSGQPRGMRRAGDWEGLVLLGDARINTGEACAGGGAGCLEAVVEGFPATHVRAKFGGLNDTGSCGDLHYVRLEFAGAAPNPGVELNGLTVAGCGAGTKLSYIQVHRGTDDGIELLGGNASMDHVVLSANEDDSLDWDYGWRGNVQFLVIHQRSGAGDFGIEGAGSPYGETLAPLSSPTLYNVTMVSANPSGKAIVLKEGTLGKIHNSIIQGWQGDVVDFRSAEVNYATLWPAMVSIQDTLFWMNGVFPDESIPTMGVSQDDDRGFPDQAAVEAPARMNATTVNPMLPAVTTLTAVGEARPSYIPENPAVSGAPAPPTNQGFDATGTYRGAFAPGGADWTLGWTDYPLN